MLGCTIEPAPAAFQMRSSTLSLCPRYVVRNTLPAAVEIRAELHAPDAEPPEHAPPHVELGPQDCTDIYCFEAAEQLEQGGGGGGGGGSAGSGSGGCGSGGGGGSGEAEGGEAGGEGGGPERVLRFRLAHGAWAWSVAVPVDRQGSSHFLLTCSGGADVMGGGGGPPPEPPLLRVTVAACGCTLFITLYDASAAPPFAVENRTSTPLWMWQRSGRGRTAATAVADAADPHEQTAPPVALPPMRWTSSLPEARGGLASPSSAELVLHVGCLAGGDVCSRSYSLQHIGERKPLKLPGRRLYAEVQQRGSCRILILTAEPIAPRRRAARIHGPSSVQVHARLGGLSLALLDERVRGAARPEELLNAAVQGVVLALSLDQGAVELQLRVSHLQLDNLLPESRFGILLQCPRRSTDTPQDGAAGGRGMPPSQQSSSAGRAGGGRAGSEAAAPQPAVRLVVLRRRPGQLQLVQFELRPLTLALEAPLLLRLGRLASTAVGAHTYNVTELAGPGRAAVAGRLASALEEPPTYSAGSHVLYCETLRISEVEIEVSSTLDPHEEEGAAMLSTAPDWVAVCYRLPLLRNLLQSMLVLIKGIGMNLANVSAVPFHFDGELFHCPCSYPLTPTPAPYPCPPHLPPTPAPYPSPLPQPPTPAPYPALTPHQAYCSIIRSARPASSRTNSASMPRGR